MSTNHDATDRSGAAASESEAAVGRLLLPRLEEHRARLFEELDGVQRFGDGGLVTLTLTNAEARALLDRR